jgi:dihydroorotase
MDPFLCQPSVDFQLLFARPTHPDTHGLTRQVGPHPLEPRQRVFQLCQLDSQARFDPPLRSGSDRDALRAAAAEGLAAVCSDHTPVDEDGKLLPFAEALPGATALELLLPLTLKWAEEN